MWALFSLIFLAILLAAAVAGVWLVWTIVALIFAKRKVRSILWGFPVSVLVVAIAFGALAFYEARPNTIFERQIGFAPPSDTQVVNGSSSALGDAGSAYLYFKTSPATLQRIVAIGFQPGDSNFSTSESPPDWYAPRTGPTVQSYMLESRISSFASEHRELVYDPATGEAWFMFSGVD